MLSSLWSWVKENLGFLNTTGSYLSFGTGAAVTAAFHRFFVEGDGLTLGILGELIFIGLVVSAFTAVAGYVIFRGNWPKIHIGSFWEEINKQNPKIEELNKSSGQDAVDTAMQIVRESQEARLRNRGFK